MVCGQKFQKSCDCTSEIPHFKHKMRSKKNKFVPMNKHTIGLIQPNLENVEHNRLF